MGQSPDQNDRQVQRAKTGGSVSGAATVAEPTPVFVLPPAHKVSQGM